MPDLKLTGKIIKDLRPMTDEEKNDMGWSRGTTVIELSDGRRLFASRDDEGNDAGAMYLVDTKGKVINLI